MGGDDFQLSVEAAEVYEAQFVPALFGRWAPHLVRAAGVAVTHLCQAGRVPSTPPPPRSTTPSSCSSTSFRSSRGQRSRRSGASGA